MNEKVLEFAEEQNKILLDTFLKKGFSMSEFNDALLSMTYNSFVGLKLLNDGIFNPTDKQLLDYDIRACDDLIKWFIELKQRMMCEEV